MNDRSVRVPDLMVIGAAKSGTTSVAHQLRMHPQVYLPAAKKEPHYFSFADAPPEYADLDFTRTIVWRWSDYLALYAGAGEDQRICDCSTSYLYRHGVAVPHIRRIYGDRVNDLALFAVLRDPVERAYSHWLYLVRNGHEDLPFEEAVLPAHVERRRSRRWGFDYLGYGRYAEAIDHFREVFPRFKVFLFEDLKAPQVMFDQLCAAAGLEPSPVQDVRTNPGGVPRSRWLVRTLRRGRLLRSLSHLAPDNMRSTLRVARDRMLRGTLERPEMPAGARAFLNDHFRDDVDRLARTIGRDLSHWCAR